jgi:TATA-box binding protein (TBP) (component of TFIID and TFIIIB)
MSIIPNNISISTMNLACKFETLINIIYIYKYMTLENDSIICIKSSEEQPRYTADYKNKFKSMNKNLKKIFRNQITLIVNIDVDRYINVKLFKNGSMQFSGCKFLNDANIVINKLIKKFKEKLIVKTDNELIEVDFVENVNGLYLSKFKIDLINSNFAVCYMINKESLNKILINNNIICRLSTVHSCVNIKYKIMNENKYISIFVFHTGNIIITGANKPEQIRETYNFIVKFLKMNKTKIIKKNINELLQISDINEILGI